jgi:hypothetical protein
MHWPSRTQPKHAFAALVILWTVLGAAMAHAEIFKCTTKDGSPLYQNFPCDIDSLGSLPSNSPVAKSASNSPTTKTAPIASAAGQEKSKTAHINLASIVKSTHMGEPRVGMTAEEVRELLGAPEEMVDDEPAEGGRVSVWRFADGRLVQFDHKHRVSEIRR